MPFISFLITRHLSDPCALGIWWAASTEVQRNRKYLLFVKPLSPRIHRGKYSLYDLISIYTSLQPLGFGDKRVKSFLEIHLVDICIKTHFQNK